MGKGWGRLRVRRRLPYTTVARCSALGSTMCGAGSDAGDASEGYLRAGGLFSGAGVLADVALTSMDGIGFSERPMSLSRISSCRSSSSSSSATKVAPGDDLRLRRGPFRLPPEPGVRGVFESPAVFGSALGKWVSEVAIFLAFRQTKTKFGPGGVQLTSAWFMPPRGKAPVRIYPLTMPPDRGEELRKLSDRFAAR